MMRALAFAALAAVALLGAGYQNMAPVPESTPPSVHPPQLARVDDAFAIAAVQGNDAEIEAAKIALAHSTTDGVKAFARLMLADHGTIDAEGMPLVETHLAHQPPPLAAPDVLAMDYLQNLPPVDFDAQYAMLQIGDHLATLTAFATEARDGKDPALKAFAKKWMPTIQAHLELAVTLVKHVGGDTPFK